MKKILFCILLSVLTLTGCNKFEPAPVDTTDERLNAVLDEYSKVLENAPYGWKGYLLTKSEIPATFFFKFDGKNRVIMAADFDDEEMESSYLVKALQRPTLIFDTYSTLHLLSDPNPNVLGGATGAGYSSDFEFAFVKVGQDTVELEGLFNKSKLLLIKSKSVEESEGVFDAVEEVVDVVSNLKKYFKRTEVGGTVCEVKIDPLYQIFSLSYLVNNELVTTKSVYYVSNTEMLFYNDLEVKDVVINSLKDIVFDASANAVSAKVNGTTIFIKDNLEPLKFDPLAAQRWHAQMAANFNGCWVSDNAFYADGTPDYCNFGAVPNFQNLWYAGPAVFGAGTEALITFTGGLAAPYAAGALPGSPFLFVDGKARFTLRGSTAGFVNTTPVGRAMIAARQILFGGSTAGSFEDWYLIPTSDDGRRYDMVRVSDAEAWISWRPR